MAGKVTFRNRDGRIAEPLSGHILTPPSVPIAELEAHIGRALPERVQQSMLLTVAMYGEAMQARNEEPTMQDIKRTLSAFERLSAGEAEQALRSLDSACRALVEAAAYRGFGMLPHPYPRAAAIARRALPRTTGRRVDELERQFARCVLTWWTEAGGGDSAAYVWDDGRHEEGTALVRFASALFNVVRGQAAPLSASRVAALLTRARREGFCV